ncbi:MAG: hypothetical protein RR782_02730 [Clostridium sp.]
MIYKFYEENGDVVLTYFEKPIQKVFDFYGDRYITVENEIDYDDKKGFKTIEYVDLISKELKCRHEEIPPQPLTLEEKVKILELENQDFKIQVSELENTILLMQGVI